MQRAELRPKYPRMNKRIKLWYLPRRREPEVQKQMQALSEGRMREMRLLVGKGPGVQGTRTWGRHPNLTLIRMRNPLREKGRLELAVGLAQTRKPASGANLLRRTTSLLLRFPNTQDARLHFLLPCLHYVLRPKLTLKLLKRPKQILLPVKIPSRVTKQIILVHLDNKTRLILK